MATVIKILLSSYMEKRYIYKYDIELQWSPTWLGTLSTDNSDCNNGQIMITLIITILNQQTVLPEHQKEKIFKAYYNS